MLESHLSGLMTFKIDKERIESTIHAKELRIDSIIGIARNEVASENFTRMGSIWFMDRDFSFMRKDNMAILIYENDTLRYWSDNLVSADVLYPKAGLNDRMVKFKNAWYEIWTVREKNIKYVGLIFIKNMYVIHNKYLHNEFDPSIHLDTSMRVSMVPISYSVDLVDINHEYLCSLVPSNSCNPDGDKFNIVGLLFLLSLIMLLFFVNGVVRNLANSPGNSMKIVLLIVSVAMVRIAMLVLKFPGYLYKLDFFDPIYFSGDGLFPTLGDFVINAVVLLFVLHYVFMLADYRKLRDTVLAMSATGKFAVWGSMLLVYVLGLGYLYSNLGRLVGEGTISFMLNNFMSLDIFSFSGILIFVIFTAIVIYISVRFTEYFDYTLIQDQRRSIIYFLSASVAVSLLAWAFSGMLAAIGALYALLVIGTALLMHYQKVETVLYRYIFMLFISALFSCTMIYMITESRIDSNCRSMVTSPSNFNDPIAEMLLKDVSDKLPGDELCKNYLLQIDNPVSMSRLREHLQRRYFNGYWSKYNMSVKILKGGAGEFFSQIDDEFVRIVNESGEIVSDTRFYRILNADGTISYYSPIQYNQQGQAVYICIMLDRKVVPQDLGFPELLIDKSIKPSPIDEYDYARYHKSHKVLQNGTFSYDITDRVFMEGIGSEPGDSLRVVRLGDYIHTVYHSGDTTMVLSRTRFSFLDFVTHFAYLFVIFILVMLVFVGIRLVLNHNTQFSHHIKTRLIASLVWIFFFSFIFICAGTIYMNVRKQRAQNSKAINEKVRSVHMELSQIFADTTHFDTRWSRGTESAIDECLTSLSHVFFTDINLYGADGMLIACSRPEVFRQEFLSTYMNRTAMRSLAIEKKASFIQDEHIGTMTYASAYIPFCTQGDSIVAYINLPYFTKPGVLRSELSTIIVSITNLYVVLMMISIVVAVFVSEKIVQPIKMIQSKMETIELGKNYEKIDYPEKDELGQLVTEYNRMVDKLDESAKLLAQGERESAWRTMARQVAHEIKNPLTPMKLSIQFLTRTWQQDDSNFGDKLSKVSNTLIQQIDTLSSIATSFSNFAKMPQPVAVPLNVVEMLGNVVALYQNTENIDVTSDLGNYKEIICMLDKEQITRVFVNIIKNATQAIPDGVRGKIHVTLSKESSDKVVVRIADNGTGIPDEIRDKLFTPNFTTKSSGSGLGLAMVKTMVENVKGSITFESEVGKGTTFIITLPIKED